MKLPSVLLPPPVVLQGRDVKVTVAAGAGGLGERYFARQGEAWIEAAVSGEGGTAGAVFVIGPDRFPLAGDQCSASLEGGDLVEKFAAAGNRLTRRISLMDDGPWLRVTTRLEPAGEVTLHQWYDQFRFLGRADWTYAPSVGGFVPDGMYKAPLILVQAGPVAFGIVPDLAALGARDLLRCNHAIDLDVPGGPILKVGFIPARLSYHSVFAPHPGRFWTTGVAIENVYYILLTASGAAGEAYREAVHFHWEKFGRPAQPTAARQQQGTGDNYGSLALWDDWREKVWNQESRAQWLAVPLPDGSTGGGVSTRRWGPGSSVYLSSWFNTLRTSFAMALHARRVGNAKLTAQAGETVALALKAPGKNGAFKCIAVPREGNPTLWAAGDGSGGSTEEGFLGYDMAWTGYWLLRWRAAGLPENGGILPRCRALANFFVDRQAGDGMFPTRFSEDASVEEAPSRTVKAETGPIVLFLLELHAQDANPRLLQAALRGLDFIAKDVIPLRQWYDYETFWSCSPRQAEFDERTGQWPANNLALSQTVAAYLLAHRITGDATLLRRGEALLDYLLLFQQCWTNPVIEDLSCPAMLLGGFTTQNADAEWSDARQSQCGCILLDYYRATGKAEYLERGVAALRAQFPVSPAENWAHKGYGGKEGVSSFHWGTGSGMAGIEIEEDYLRDAIVDVSAARGAGVNGLDLRECRVDGAAISLRLSSPFSWTRPPVVVFRRTDPSRTYRLEVNGADAGSWPGAEMEKGIALQAPSD